MAIKTMSHSSGGGKWSEGWHTLTISKGEYGDWNDKKYIDIFFDGYPETFKLRVFQAQNKENHEEFAIARFFKFANAGVIDIIKSSDGKEALQYDDDVKGLVGKQINGFFYMDNKGDKQYAKISDRIAPTVQLGDIISYSEDDVLYWKSVSEKHYNEYLKKSESNTPTASNSEEENTPF